MSLVFKDTSDPVTDNYERLVAKFRSLLLRATAERPLGEWLNYKVVDKIHAVFTRLSAAALFNFLVFQMQRLFGGGAYLRVALFKTETLHL